jgi:oligopeptide/dipeptide ABC transporter ATP-binding protein
MTAPPRPDAASPDVLLEVSDLRQSFPLRAKGGARIGTVSALAGVSFTLGRGETLGIVGESGCGKSTLARSILQVPRPTSGQVRLAGTDLVGLPRAELRKHRMRMQAIFQDPFTSLNPRWRVSQLIEEPLVIRGEGTPAERRDRVAALLETVGLDADQHGQAKARELSGGQCQRVAVARALAASPELVICDEVVSALDVVIQAQVLNLFEQMKAEFGLSYLFISHDLAVVRHVSDRIAVMYLGLFCELGSSTELYERPAHPYTRALLAAVTPDPGETREPSPHSRLKGEPPSAANPPSGCRFRTRCPIAQQRCSEEVPQMRRLTPDRWVACHFPLEPPEPVSQAAATDGEIVEN